MIQYSKTRGIVYLTIIVFTFLLTQDHISAEESVYDTYQLTPIAEEEHESSEEGKTLTNVDEDLSFNAGEKSKTGFFLVLKIIFYLVIILIMIYGLIRFLASRQRKLGHHQLFQTLGGTSLGSNKSLQIVKVGNTYYLLGVAEQISLIKEITSSEEIALIEKDIAEQESIITRSFGQIFKSWNSDQDGRNSFQNMFTESLEQQKSKRADLEKKWSTTQDNNEEGTST